MRWNGSDLVSICSTLGFQSCKKSPMFAQPMPLPIQWSGPLGWLQFRPGFEGCVAEFRPRAVMPKQVRKDLHGYNKDLSVATSPANLVDRLSYSLGAFWIGRPDKEALPFIGSEDFEKILELVEDIKEQDSDEATVDEEGGNNVDEGCRESISSEDTLSKSWKLARWRKKKCWTSFGTCRRFQRS